ncbi:MAG: sulfotransferase, partial [Actinobacteria bacterium]
MTISPDRPTAAPTPVTRLPDFFIAGQPKSGTTALYEMLKRHPQIYMSPVKEPFYFAADNPLPEGTDGRRWRSLEQTGIRAESLERYASLFAPARPDQKAGEATTSYL